MGYKYKHCVTIDNMKTHSEIRYFCDDVEYYGNMVVGKREGGYQEDDPDAKYYGSGISFMFERSADTIISVSDVTEDDEIYMKISGLQGEDWESLKNFLKTAGLI